MTEIMTSDGRRASGRLASALLIGTALAGMPVAAQAPVAAPAPVSAPAAPATKIIRSIDVTGNQRLEPDTVRSYVKLHPGDRSIPAHSTRMALRAVGIESCSGSPAFRKGSMSFVTQENIRDSDTLKIHRDLSEPKQQSFCEHR